MSNEVMSFGPYDERKLAVLLSPRLNRAFREGTLPSPQIWYQASCKLLG